MEKRISHNIQICSFVMTCFMVFYHVGVIDGESLSVFDEKINSLLNSFFAVMVSFVMHYFFAVTGFLLLYGLHKDNYISKMCRRFQSLFIPYLAWQIVTLILNLKRGMHFSLKDFFTTTFLFVRWPYNGPLWYVYAIFLMAFFSPILLFFYKKEKIGFISLVIGIFLIQVLKNVPYPFIQNIVGYGFIPNIVAHIPAYLIGAFCGKLIEKKNYHELFKYLLFLSIIALILNIPYPGIFYEVLISIIPLSIIFLLPECSIDKMKKLFEITFIIYAMHAPVISVFKDRVFNFLNQPNMPISITNIFMHVILLGIDILCARFVYVILSRISPFLLSIFTGGRHEKTI